MMELYIALAVLDLLVLWVLVLVLGAWIPRAVAIAAALVANLWLLAAAPDVSGLPTSAEPPDRVRLAGCIVDEPRHVYLWLVTGSEPRGYRQPYSRELHAVCEDALRAAARGVTVGLGRKAGSGGPQTSRRFLYDLRPHGNGKAHR